MFLRLNETAILEKNNDGTTSSITIDLNMNLLEAADLTFNQFKQSLVDHINQDTFRNLKVSLNNFKPLGELRPQLTLRQVQSVMINDGDHIMNLLDNSSNKIGRFDSELITEYVQTACVLLKRRFMIDLYSNLIVYQAELINAGSFDKQLLIDRVNSYEPLNN